MCSHNYSDRDCDLCKGQEARIAELEEALRFYGGDGWNRWPPRPQYPQQREAGMTPEEDTRPRPQALRLGKQIAKSSIGGTLDAEYVATRIELLIREAVFAEREACLTICREVHAEHDIPVSGDAAEIERRIRSRSEAPAVTDAGDVT